MCDRVPCFRPSTNQVLFYSAGALERTPCGDRMVRIQPPTRLREMIAKVVCWFGAFFSFVCLFLFVRIGLV